MPTGALTLTELLKQYYGGQLLPLVERWTEFAKDFLTVAKWEEGVGVELTTYTRYKTLLNIDLDITARTFSNNGAILPSYQDTERITEEYGRVARLTTMPLSVYLQIPEGDRKTIREREDIAQSASLGLDIATFFFYGDKTINSALPNGLVTKYDSLSNPQVLNANGTPDQNGKVYDIWIVNWSDGIGASLHYPKGTTAGIQVIDMGMQITNDSVIQGAVIPSISTLIASYFAVVIPKPECIVRITNVSPDVVSEELLNQAFERIDTNGNGEISIFMHRSIYTALLNNVLQADKGRKSYIINLTDKTIGNDVLYFKNNRNRFRIVELPQVEPLT